MIEDPREESTSSIHRRLRRRRRRWRRRRTRRHRPGGGVGRGGGGRGGGGCGRGGLAATRRWGCCSTRGVGAEGC
jgi:hypothetical protein